jgi:hypothetical protein
MALPRRPDLSYGMEPCVKRNVICGVEVDKQ